MIAPNYVSYQLLLRLMEDRLMDFRGRPQRFRPVSELQYIESLINDLRLLDRQVRPGR